MALGWEHSPGVGYSLPGDNCCLTSQCLPQGKKEEQGKDNWKPSSKCVFERRSRMPKCVKALFKCLVCSMYSNL